MRANIYYDQDNTSYYLNPVSSTLLTTANNAFLGLNNGQLNHKVEIRGVGIGSSNYDLVVRNSSRTNNMCVRDRGRWWLRVASWTYGLD